jgi:hypothetical protein
MSIQSIPLLYYNIKNIKRIFEPIQIFPDPNDSVNTIQHASSYVSLYNDNKILLGKLISSSVISKFDDNNQYCISITSNIYINVGSIEQTITYVYSTISNTNLVQQIPGTTLICDIIASNNIPLTPNSKLKIYFFNQDGDAVITII